MTDLINYRNLFEKKCLQKFPNLKKFTPKTNIQSDSNGIMTLTEKQCRHRCYTASEKKYFTSIYRLLPVSTTIKKNRFKQLYKLPKYVGTAHTLKQPFKTFKII